ncbi:MAG: hypothetical protein JW928_00150 [Candidatus Aureabacteria bacterium]|nr:hypothetical protein [Candidatus Auribacterota bacterium]
MTVERKKIQAIIERIPLVSWYVQNKAPSYSIERAGKALTLSDALLK